MYVQYIYIRISSILYYIEQNFFLNVIVRPGIESRLAFLLKKNEKE